MAKILGGFWFGYGTHAGYVGDWGLAAVFIALGTLAMLWDIGVRVRWDGNQSDEGHA